LEAKLGADALSYIKTCADACGESAEPYRTRSSHCSNLLFLGHIAR